MSAVTQSQDSLKYVPIVGAGVDALDRRKEHNGSDQVTAAKLQASINVVKTELFAGLKALTVKASARLR